MCACVCVRVFCVCVCVCVFCCVVFCCVCVYFVCVCVCVCVHYVPVFQRLSKVEQLRLSDWGKLKKYRIFPWSVAHACV